MPFSPPSDVAFSILGMPVYYYGIILAAAIFTGIYCAYCFYKKFYDPIKADNIIEFSPYLIIFGIIGARLYYCAVNFSYYFAHPSQILNIRQGGLSVHGMIIVGILFLYLASRKYKMPFLALSDVFTCSTALAQSIGRWGNFFNSEAFGTPTDLPWKLFVPVSQRPVQYLNYEYFHPTFLYESILDLMIFVILFCIMKKHPEKTGVTTAFYLILYATVRFFVESIRIDSVLNISGIPIAQIVSVVMLILGGILLRYRRA